MHGSLCAGTHKERLENKDLDQVDNGPVVEEDHALVKPSETGMRR